MRRRIAELLVSIARRLDKHINYEMSEEYEPVQLGIGYHLTKSDVRNFRKSHPEYTSYRKGLGGMVDDTKHVILGNIAAGLVEKGLLEFKVKKTLWTADVTGKVVVYRRKNAEAQKDLMKAAE